LDEGEIGMNALLIFYEKPASSNKEFALRLAQKYNPIYDNGRYKLIFNEFTNDIKKVLEISQHWKTAQLFIDEHEYNIHNVVLKLSCYNKSHCNGLCYFVSELNTISRLKDALDSDHYSITWWLNNYAETIPGIIKIDNAINIDHEVVKQAIVGIIDETLQFCDRFDINKILALIDSLPSTLEIVDQLGNSDSTIDDKLDDEYNECDDDSNDFTISDEGIEKYSQIAEIMAPIFAREIVKEIKKLMQEIAETSEHKSHK
jgi:hypothetical protein